MTKKEKTSRKRKKLFVDSKVQGSLVRQLILQWGMICVLIFFYLFAMQALSNGFSYSFGENLTAVWQNYGVFALVLLVLSPVFIYDAVKLSNRFVGPMVSFKKSLRRLASGEDVADIKFRDQDFWKELAADFNELNREMRRLRNEDDAVKDAAKEKDSDAHESDLVEQA